MADGPEYPNLEQFQEVPFSLTQQVAPRVKRSPPRWLPTVTLRNGVLHVSPTKAMMPPEAERLDRALDRLLPRVRITELLHEVCRRTGFAYAFTDLRSGKQVENENALLAAILADGTNLGLERMAHASQGVTKAQLAWIHTWHLREETYKSALGAIINAHHAEPMAAIWGAGATSSSDGQFFRAGRRGYGPGDINAKYGVDPGMLFYTHISDQYGPFYGKVLSATMSEAPHVLDGLLHHGTALIRTPAGRAIMFLRCAISSDFASCRAFATSRIIVSAPLTLPPNIKGSKACLAVRSAST